MSSVVSKPGPRYKGIYKPRYISTALCEGYLCIYIFFETPCMYPQTSLSVSFWKWACMKSLLSKHIKTSKKMDYSKILKKFKEII